MRFGEEMDSREVPVRAAMEIAAVGIVPSEIVRPIGHSFVMAGQTFSVTGVATRDEFTAALARERIPFAVENVPAGFVFLKVSTD